MREKSGVKKVHKALTLAAACVLMIMALPLTAYADMGPKPSVQISFTGIAGETYYGTLLSESMSTGPASAWDGTEADARYPDGEYEIWKAFTQDEDTAGFYFLQVWWDCSETGELKWTYYPPSTFKVLLYFPNSGDFYVSPIYTRYAFDSYFTVDLAGRQNGGLIAEKSYDYTLEIVSFAARTVLTVLLELGIAWLFGYREKRLFSFLVPVNVITQILLNVLLNIINYNSGSMVFTFSYLLIEIAVFVIEAVLYALLLQRYSAEPQNRGKAVCYALISNAASFAAGFWIAHWIPGIF